MNTKFPKMKKGIAMCLALALSAALLVGCKAEKTPEEVEAERLAAIAAEEAETGLKRLDSPNLEDYEMPIVELANAIRNQNPKEICYAIGSPTVLTDDEVYGWILESGLDSLLNNTANELRMRSEKANATATLIVYAPDDDPEGNDAGIEFQTIYENGRWLIVPENGVEFDYTFEAPTNKVTCSGISLEEYAGSVDEDGNWTFTIPRIVKTNSFENIQLETQLGVFDAIIYESKQGFSTVPLLIANMTSDQKDEYSQNASSAIMEVFNLLESGASQSDVSKILLSESLIEDCYPEKEEERQVLMEKWATVESVTVSPATPKNGAPDASTYRLYKDNAIVLDSKLLIKTTDGECHRLSTITMQMINGEWKIVNLQTDDKSNPFTEFNVYNPAW